MKIIQILVLVFILVSCNPNAQENSAETESVNLIDETSSYPLTIKHVGFWVNEDYISKLKTSKSTKVAASSSVDDFYSINSDNSIMQMNIHEGAGRNILILKSQDIGTIYSSDSVRVISDVNFNDSILTVNDNRYFRINDSDSALARLVNDCVIVGKYFLDEKPVEFKANGSIAGMEGVESYRLNLDYNDAGMEYDKIYFKRSEQDSTDTYLYEIRDDTLRLFEIDCKYKEGDSNYCLQVGKGVVKYKLVKTSQFAEYNHKRDMVLSLLKNMDWNNSCAALDSMQKIYGVCCVTSGRSNATEHLSKDVGSLNRFHGFYLLIDSAFVSERITVNVSFAELPWRMDDVSQRIEQVVIGDSVYSYLGQK